MFNIKNVIRLSMLIASQLTARITRVILIVAATSALCITVAGAQTVQWTKYRNDQTTASVSPTCNYQGSDRNFAKDSSGNLFVAGGASESGQGAVIYKFNSVTGALLWRQNYVGAGGASDCATSIAVDSAGNVAVTGYTSIGYGTPTNFIAKYNGVTGALLWNVVTGFTVSRFESKYIQSVLAIDLADNIIVTNLGTTKYNGQTGVEFWTTRNSTDNGATGAAITIDANGDAYLAGPSTIKLSSTNGAELWNVATSSDKGKFYGRAIRLTPSNELVVTGFAGYGGGDNSEIVTIKFSKQTGAVSWNKRFAPLNSMGGVASDVTLDSSGNILVTGFASETTPTSIFVYRLVALKYAGDGTLLWSVVVPLSDLATGEGVAAGNAIVADSNGNVFVTGSYKLPNDPATSGSSRWVTVKLAGSTGAELWRKTYIEPNGRPEGGGAAILFDTVNDPIVLGYTSGPNYSRTIRVLSYASANGALKSETSSKLIDAPSEAQSIVVDNSANLIVAGSFGGSAAVSTQMTKYDGATGQELWSVEKPLSYRPLLVTAANGDIFYAGNPFFPSSSVPGMRVQKHSSTTGQLLWEAVSDLTTLGFSTVAVTDANSNIYITGTTRATLGSSANSARTVKFSGATGAEMWRSSYSGTADSSQGVSMAILPDGHVIATMLAGETSQQGTSTTVRVEKQDKANGAVIWSSTIGSVFNSGGEVIVDASGDVFVAARVSNALNSSSPVYLRVTKFSGLTGALIWKVDRSSNTSAVISLDIDTSGNPLVGHSEAVTKFDGQTGNLIWTTPFLGAYLNDIQLLSSGQVAAGGWSYGVGTSKDMRLVFYDGVTGSPIWSYAHDGGASADDNLFAFTTKGTNIFLAGSSQRLTRKPSWFVQKLGNAPAPAPFPLNLVTNGTGGGSIASSPAGLPCEPTCNGGLHAGGAIVTITPTPRADSVFAAWSGACTGSGICQITMSKAQFVAATFNLRKVPLNVAFVGSGAGTVISEPAGLNCSANCAVGFDYNSLVTLTATASTGSTFIRWGGACFPPDSRNLCTVQITDLNTVKANFSLGTAKLYINKPLYEQSIPLRGNVTSMPSGINCSPDCFYTYPTGTVVTLTATPLQYTTFAGWGSYPGCAGLGPCTVTMNSDVVSISPVFDVTVTTVLSGGTGTGTISIPSRLYSCGTRCELRLLPNELPVTLVAAPSKGSVFVGWSGGGCSGNGVCLPRLGTSTITAIFNSITSGTELSADGKSDLIFRNGSTGQISAWLMNGTASTSTAGLVPPGSWNVSHTADFNGDGRADILYRNDDGSVTLWLMNGLSVVGSVGLLGPNPDWRVSHVGDFNGDGKADLLWRNNNGAVTLWLMDGTTIVSSIGLLGADPNWSVSHVADFNGDGKADLLWRNTNGAVTMWLMNGTAIASTAGLLGADPNWRVSHVADFDGDGKADLLWRNTNGAVTTWLMNGTAIASTAGLLGADANWSVSHTGDFNGDGKADLLWRNTNGAVTQWLMNGASILSAAGLLGPDPNWRVTHLGDYNGDGKSDLLWRNTSDGSITMWLMNGAATLSAAGILGASPWIIVPPMP